ncbi:MAG: RHS repeat-associated core domain-containing protein [Enterobacterales bacterium]|nr:RHS repeat-associated core domain-containing protein [Enterobacterales bacterium]
MPDSVLHRDRLGSMIGSFDEQGNLRQHHSYDPFGKPRDGRLRDNFTDVLTGITIPQNILGSEITNRGFTDHEHLDDAQLIHMNGRVYDYNLGRFLSVDPFIQAPGNSQSMNPYSYIMNNPLAGTDPSGYAADIDQDKLEVKVTSQSRTRSAPTGSRIKRDTSRTITATVTDESGTSSNYVYTAARNGSESAFKITPITLKLDNTDLGSKGQVGVGTSEANVMLTGSQSNTQSGEVDSPLAVENQPDVVLNQEQERKVILMRSNMADPDSKTEEQYLIDKDGNTSTPTTAGCDANGCALTKSQINNSSVIAHLHNLEDGFKGSATARELPGPSDHIPVEQYGVPVVIYAPSGAIRVVERISGTTKVRTIYGGRNRNNSKIASKWKAGMTSSQLSKIAKKLR